ncbi:MAG: hypothetical protein EXR98_16110 [Gemmataceae bacterium]|nr:hypothetical protein [Gemmataceae bacterium]
MKTCIARWGILLCVAILIAGGIAANQGQVPQQIALPEPEKKPLLTVDAARQALIEYFASENIDNAEVDKGFGLTKATKANLIDVLRNAEVTKVGDEYGMGGFLVSLDRKSFRVNPDDTNTPFMLGWYCFENDRWKLIGPFRSLVC